MAVTEAERIELIHRLEQAVGAKAAATLMEYLPASGWLDVTTTDDLDQTEARLNARIDQVEARIDQVEARLNARINQVEARIDTAVTRSENRILEQLVGQTRTVVITYVGGLVAFAAVLLTALSVGRP